MFANVVNFIVGGCWVVRLGSWVAVFADLVIAWHPPSLYSVAEHLSSHEQTTGPRKYLIADLCVAGVFYCSLATIV